MANTFLLEQKPLLALLSAMQPMCTRRTTLDATASILFQVGHRELVLKSTDLEISLQAACELKKSDLQEPQSFLVSGRRIFELVKELDGDIKCTIDKAKLSLTANKVNVSLNIKDAQEFPPFPERIENLMQLEAATLLEMLNKVLFLIPQHNANPALNGLFIEISEKEFKMTTTDGHCLAQVTCDKYTLSSPRQWLLPRKAIVELKKLIESSNDQHIFLGVCGNQLVFSGLMFNFFTKLLASTFPQYSAILDRQGFIPAKVDRAEFVKALRRAACLLSGQFIATNFLFAESAVRVSMHNKEVGSLEEQLPLHEFGGAHLDIRFYAPYLLQGLQVFSEQMSICYLHNATRPIIFESNDKELRLLYLVMPVSPSAAA